MTEPKKPDSELSDREILLEILRRLRMNTAAIRSAAASASYDATKLRYARR